MLLLFPWWCHMVSQSDVPCSCDIWFRKHLYRGSSMLNVSQQGFINPWWFHGDYVHFFFRCSFHKSSLSDTFTYLLVFLARYPSYVCVTLLPSNKWRFCYSAARVLRGMPVFVVRSWENVSAVSVYCHWDPEMLEGWHHLSSLPNLLSSNNISLASRDMWLYSEAR